MCTGLKQRDEETGRMMAGSLSSQAFMQEQNGSTFLEPDVVWAAGLPDFYIADVGTGSAPEPFFKNPSRKYSLFCCVMEDLVQGGQIQHVVDS